MDGGTQVTIRFQAEDGNVLGDSGILLPSTSTTNQLQILANQLLEVRNLDLKARFNIKTRF